MKTVLISGGTGLIGSALTRELIKNGFDVIILTRNTSRKKNTGKISYAEWNIREEIIDARAIEKADYIIHLAGANVAQKRWSEKRKKEIVDSRVQSGQLLVKALKEIPNKVKAIVSASAIGWYGPDAQLLNPRSFIETDNAANDFLGTTCQQWESAIQPVTQIGKRLVILRTGIVLSKDGGAFVEFKKPLQFGVASILGSGKQVISWIHINDLVRLYMYAIENENISGIYNAVAPEPVTNKTLVMEMAKQRNKFYVPVTVPSFVLKAVLGEMSIEVLKSATVSNKKIEATGFQFWFSGIQTAVHNLIKQKK